MQIKRTFMKNPKMTFKKMSDQICTRSEGNIRGHTCQRGIWRSEFNLTKEGNDVVSHMTDMNQCELKISLT